MVEVVYHIDVPSEITDGFGKIMVSLSSPFKLAELEKSALSSSYPPLRVDNTGEFLHDLCVTHCKD